MELNIYSCYNFFLMMLQLIFSNKACNYSEGD